MSDEIMTTSDVDEVLADIHVALDSLYKTDQIGDLHLHSRVSALLEQGDKSQVSDSLKNLENKLTLCERLHITMSFVPERELVQKIYLWAVKNINKNVILSFKYETSLLGGCAVSYKGRYFDRSLTKLVDDYFEKAVKV